MRKTRGKSAWLITWEGNDSEFIGRCKVVAILPPLLAEKTIKAMLPVLFCSEYTFSLCEKMGFSTSIKKDHLLRELHRDINPEFSYGYFSKEYLSARKVKNLRSEESKKDCFECTLYWTELPKYLPKPFDLNAPSPDNPCDSLKQIIGERDVSYTYSIRRSIEEEKIRRNRKSRH